jgi:hypothetical protein
LELWGGIQQFGGLSAVASTSAEDTSFDYIAITLSHRHDIPFVARGFDIYHVHQTL